MIIISLISTAYNNNHITGFRQGDLVLSKDFAKKALGAIANYRITNTARSDEPKTPRWRGLRVHRRENTANKTRAVSCKADIARAIKFCAFTQPLPGTETFVPFGHELYLCQALAALTAASCNDGASASGLDT